MRVIAICALFINLAAHAADLRLDDLRSVLKKNRSSWTARETEISQLNSEQRKRRLGANDISAEDHFVQKGGPTPVAAYPAHFDWRDVKGVSYVPPVEHQGTCGSCIAFSVVAALQTQLNIEQRTDPAAAWQFSPQHLFSCGGATCNGGWFVENALAQLSVNGVPDAACLSYYSGQMGQDVACSLGCVDWSSRAMKIVSYSRPTVNQASVENVKQALMRGPVIAIMNAYEDFYYYSSGVYRFTQGKFLGGHAVLLIGWDDKDKAWIGKNSWGTRWGEQGFFRIAWGDHSQIGNNTWSIEVPKIDGTVYALGLRDGALLSGKVQWGVISNLNDSSETGWKIYKDRLPVAEGTATSLWDSSEILDGEYLFIPETFVGDKKYKGQPRLVHVFNGELKGSAQITYPPAQSVLSGRVDTHMQISSSPVPFTEVILKIDEVEPGKGSYEVSSSNVSGSLITKWHTRTVPNGKYRLTVVGYAGKTKSIRSEPVEVTIQNPESP